MSPALRAVRAFGEAFAAGDADAVLATMTDDPVFESTTPPDGHVYRGRRQVRDAFAEFFRSSPTARFETEAEHELDDRVVVLWRYAWADDAHVRGVDVFRVEDGRVAEKRSYVKG